MNRRERILQCAMCGREYITTAPKSKYCSYECKYAADRVREVEKRKKRRERMAPRETTKSVAQIDKLAKKAGMTYGEYVAKMKG